MRADIAGSYPGQLDWADLSVIHRHTLKPRANFHLYDDEASCLARDESKRRAVSLSGEWMFQLTNSPLELINHDDAADGSWKSITVPGMWQLQGYGKGPHYTNIQYPFFVDPPTPPYTNNETGHYIRKFDVPSFWKHDQIRLRFEGVDSAFHVYVNGKQVGYSQGARNPSEFDITAFIKQEVDNLLYVRVYQFCNGSYIEDQDQWWLSGIFRDVFLLSFPKTHFEDFTVNTNLDHKYKDARLDVCADVSGTGKVHLKLLDADHREVASGSTKIKSAAHSAAVNEPDSAESSRQGRADFSFNIKDPHKWTAETPYLYHLVLSIDDKIFTGHRVGFRKVEVKDGLLKVNGERIVFKGANRHEHHPRSGRAVPFEFMEKDLHLMKTHNINAIRTCHQPSDPRMYDLADELGFWVMDEADLECHGFGYLPDAHTYTSDNSDWKDSYLDRAQQLVHRDKLHPCVVLWSLGNEAFYGRNHTSMVKWIKSYDPSRPIHYEQDFNADHVDIYSRMYASTDEIINFAHTKSQDKPLVLCEYVHAMGTGPGGIKEYVEAFYKYPSLQGGWVWEWANHGLLRKNTEGEEFYGYGGDFHDEPNDGTFVMDGVLNSDHSPNSGLIEYKKAIEPVQVTTSKAQHVKITNRRDFTTLADLVCHWHLVDEHGGQKGKGVVDLPHVKPGDTAELRLPRIQHGDSAETLVELSFQLKEATTWAPEGHEVAWGQVSLTPVAPVVRPSSQNDQLHLEQLGSTIVVSTSRTKWIVDLAHGSLSSWQKDDVEIITQPLEPSFYRAPTDNDLPQDGWDWRDRRLQYATVQTRSATWRTKKDTAIVEFRQVFAPPVIAWYIDLTTTYTFYRNGSVEINVKGTPKGDGLPRTLPRIGVTLGMPNEFQNVTWFGRGPGESYKDMKESQKVNLHSASSIDQLWAGPDHPQECSNRTDTRWLKLASPDRNLTVQFYKPKHTTKRHLFDFMASHYDVKDIDRAKHPFELEKNKKDYVVLRLDADHHGLGTASCGPKTRDEYALKTEPFEFGIVLF